MRFEFAVFLRRPDGTSQRTDGPLFPHASTPRNKDRFLRTPVGRGANKICASGEVMRSLAVQAYLTLFLFFAAIQFGHFAAFA